MSDFKRLGTQIIGTFTTRRISIATLTGCTVPALMAALLCSCTPTTQHAVVQEGGGQRIIPHQYAKMWDETLSEPQWLELLRQRIHQPIAVWQGIPAGWIRANGAGLSFRGLQFRDSQSYVLEHHLWQNALMEEHPLMFLELFDDPDPETVLTGVAAYMRAMNEAQFVAKQLDRATTDRIAETFRNKLLVHRDVRIRWAAVYTLGNFRWLTCQDIKRGLDDESDEVSVTTAFWLAAMMDQGNPDSNRETQGRSHLVSRLTNQSPPEQDALLATTLLDHVNDNHFYVRQMASTALRLIFQHRLRELQAEGALQDPPELPERFDWVRSDWQRRCATQAIWRQWWAQHGTVPAT